MPETPPRPQDTSFDGRPRVEAIEVSLQTSFSTHHLVSIVNGMIEDCRIFCNVLFDFAGKGEEFQMEEAAIRLTIDIIARVVL